VVHDHLARPLRRKLETACTTISKMRSALARECGAADIVVEETPTAADVAPRVPRLLNEAELKRILTRGATSNDRAHPAARP
jgi:hypothetical protein